MTKKSKTKEKVTYICSNCGSEQVEQLMWVDLNTREIKDPQGEDSKDYWCRECEGHHRVEVKELEEILE